MLNFSNILLNCVFMEMVSIKRSIVDGVVCKFNWKSLGPVEIIWKQLTTIVVGSRRTIETSRQGFESRLSIEHTRNCRSPREPWYGIPYNRDEVVR